MNAKNYDTKACQTFSIVFFSNLQEFVLKWLYNIYWENGNDFVDPIVSQTFTLIYKHKFIYILSLSDLISFHTPLYFLLSAP